LHLASWLLWCLAALLIPASFTQAQTTDLSPAVRLFVRVQAQRIVLAHVRVIDGTGAASLEDQNVTIVNGKIAAIGPGADTPTEGQATVLDLRGYSVMPGIVGMHNHLFYVARPNLTLPRHYDPP